jgi:hypothetical protein
VGLASLAQVELETGAGLPELVKEEFDALLECGIPSFRWGRLWPTASCACVAPSAPMRSSWLSPDGCPPGRSRPAEFVTVTFDVSENGRVHNARITEQSPNAISSVRCRALESLRGNRFRPRLENGVAMDTVGSVKRFPIN